MSASPISCQFRIMLAEHSLASTTGKNPAIAFHSSLANLLISIKHYYQYDFSR